MKAYQVCADNTDGSIVVFAENSNQARYYGCRTDELDYEGYMNLRAYRLPKIDKFYQEGKAYVNWDEDDEIRDILIKEYGWCCLEPQYENCMRCGSEHCCEQSLLKEVEEDE